MLSELSIKNFAIIDDLKISFPVGFSVLTGETGTGKSIIMEAVNLLLGSRASADLVRSGCEAAELEAFFDIDAHSKTAQLLEEQGMDASDGLILRRVIAESGKSRVFINSRQSTIELLKQLTRDLAGISSQHAHQGLLREENHLDILDEFAGTAGLKNDVRSLYSLILPLQKRIRELKTILDQKRKEQELVSFQIDEIRDAAVLPHEDEDLEKKRQTLLNATKTFEAVNRSIHEIHDREGSVIEKLGWIKNELEKAGDADENLKILAQRLSGTLYDLEDMTQELRQTSSTIDLDPASLEITEQRRDLISKLKRKYGGSLVSLFQIYEDLQQQLVRTVDIEKEIDTGEKELRAFIQDIGQKAKELSGLRKTAGETLSRLAGDELHTLEMGRAKFEVSFFCLEAKDEGDIATTNREKIGPDGMDKVVFLLSPNPGEPLKPLAKIASGGELSRIVLALKAVLSRTKSLETLIFDEVDAGIGGATSEKIGLKLKQLSEKHQVICITHLAQIAKYAARQFRIYKEVVDGRTFTVIVPLERQNDRIEEIARMIGGSTITPATLSHARELLEQASA